MIFTDHAGGIGAKEAVASSALFWSCLPLGGVVPGEVLVGAVVLPGVAVAL